MVYIFSIIRYVTNSIVYVTSSIVYITIIIYITSSIGSILLAVLYVWLVRLTHFRKQVEFPSLTSFLTSDDTREAHSCLESDQLLT